MDQSSLESCHFIGGEEVSLPGEGRGTGWEDHPEEDDEALGELPTEGIETLLVEVRGAKPVGRLAARLAEIAGSLGPLSWRHRFFLSRNRSPNLPRTVDDILPLYKVLRVCNRVSGVARRRR